MYYQKTILVPANTTELSPVKVLLPLTRGTIRRFLVSFPPGCHRLTHVQVFHFGWQLLPWSPGESLAWDNYVFDLTHHYPVEVEPYDLTIRAWNDDDSYDHTVFVGVLFDEGVFDTITPELSAILRGISQ